MKIALSAPNDPRGRHIVLVCSKEEAWTAQAAVAEEVLQHRAAPVKERKGENILFRFNLRYLDRLSLTFPMAELSDGVHKMLKKAEIERLRRMPVPTCSWPGLENGKLHDYQKIAADLVVRGEIDFLNDEMGLGKGNVSSTPVLTPYGWKRIGDLKVGHQVIGSNGRATEVIGVFPKPVQPIYRVTFSDGASVKCDEDHLWTVRSSNDIERGTHRVLSTRQLLNDEIVEHFGSGQNKTKSYKYRTGYKSPSGARRWSIPMVEPVHFAPQPCNKIPIDPYVLGVTLGDGSTVKSGLVSITKGDDTEGLCDLVQAQGIETRWLADNNGHKKFAFTERKLVSLGLAGKRSWEKFVPRPYLRGTPEQRLALLQGLMDTDGYAMPDGGSEFSTTSQDLAKAVVELAQSLGGTARVNKKGRYTTYDYDGEKKTGRKSWRVNVKLPAPMIPFRLPRKADAYVVPTKYPPARWIESIERVEDESSVCIKVAAEDELYVVKDYIVTHNTITVLAAIRKLKAFPALVICPNSAKFTSWKDDIEKFFPGVSYAIVDGTPAQRAEAIEKRADITVVNFEAIRAKPIHEDDNPYKPIIGYNYSNPGLFDFVYDFVVVDEHHRVKTPNAQVTYGFFQLIGEQWLMMSGTPILNRPEEIWTALHKVYPEEYPSYEGFIREIGIFNGDRIVAYRPDALANLREFLASVSLRRRREMIRDDLPQVVTVSRVVTQSAEERKLYNRIRDELLLELEDGTTKNIMGVLPQITRLKQAAFSPELYGGSKRSSKIAELKVIVEELVASGEKAIIFSQWSKATRIIQRELAEYNPAYVTGEIKTKDRAAEIRRFMEDDSTKLYIGTIAANREAINLGIATYVIFTDSDWTPAAMDQAVGRSAAGGLRGAHLGPDVKVHVIELQAEDTIEQRIGALLQKKRNITNRVIERDGGKKIEKITVTDIRELL